MSLNDDSVFRLENAGFSYSSDAPALSGVSLEIRRGERVCILGANGCGKSTLLKIFAGLLFPQSGTFSAFGEPLSPGQMENDAFAGDYHRKVGFIFQSADVQLFCSSVRDEIAFGLLQQGLSDSEVRMRTGDVMRLLGIEPLAEKTPFRLSGGEKKKVALAAVLAMNPDVLVLDEPTNGLDPRTQSWLVHLLDALHGAGKTIVVSTHNLELVERISDRAILFSEEHTVAADRPTAKLTGDLMLLRSVNLIDDGDPV
jgi:cobalt/nickel transport system ATP-binding protein